MEAVLTFPRTASGGPDLDGIQGLTWTMQSESEATVTGRVEGDNASVAAAIAWAEQNEHRAITG